MMDKRIIFQDSISHHLVLNYLVKTALLNGLNEFESEVRRRGMHRLRK